MYLYRLRFLSAACAALFVTATAAIAASTMYMDLTLRYERDEYTALEIRKPYDYGQPPAEVFRKYSSDAGLYDLPRIFPDLTPGDPIRFRATFVEITAELLNGEIAKGYSVPVCQFGTYNCRQVASDPFDPGSGYLSYPETGGLRFSIVDYYEAEVIVEGNAKRGSEVRLVDLNSDWFTKGLSYGPDYTAYWSDQSAVFTVVANNNPAPVPLPATGVLLFGGLAGLAAWRTRRTRAA